MGPFVNSHGFEHILVMVDYVSKWVEAMPCRKASTEESINMIKAQDGPVMGRKIRKKEKKRVGLGKRKIKNKRDRAGSPVREEKEKRKRIKAKGKRFMMPKKL